MPQVSDHRSVEVATVDEQIAAIQAEVDDIDRAIAHAEAHRNGLLEQMDTLRASVAEKRLSPAEQYKRHVQRQGEERARRAAQSQAMFRALGVNVPSVDAGLRAPRSSNVTAAVSGAVGVRQRDLPASGNG